MKINKIIYTVLGFVGLIGFMSSCSPKITEPYYTTVKKLYDVNPGDKLKKVNETLGIEPYDFYFNSNEGSIVYVFKYMHQYHKYNAFAGAEEALRTGEPRFKEPNNIYMEFDQKSKKLLGYYTDNGKSKTLAILKHENTIREIQKDYTAYERLDVNGTRTRTTRATTSNSSTNALPKNRKESKRMIKQGIQQDEVYFKSLRGNNKTMQKVIYATGSSRHLWDLQDIDQVDANSYLALKGLTATELRYYKYSVLREVINASGKKASEINFYLGGYKMVRGIGSVMMIAVYPAPFVLLVRAAAHNTAKKNVAKYRGE